MSATKVAIVGGAPSSWELAPFNDDSWEIWVLGNQISNYKGKRITRIFEIHDNLSQHPKDYPQALVNIGIPIVVGPKFPIKDANVELYPEREVIALLGDNLSSSPAYMMGYALLKGYKEIGIYGVDMAVDDHEYFKQRPDMYAWIAFAKALGVKITIPPESSLFKSTYREGRDWNIKKDGVYSEDGFKGLAEMHQKKMDEIEGQIKVLQASYQSHDGARQVYERLAKVARAIDSGQKINSIYDTVLIK